MLPWDFVELPVSDHGNWCMERDALHCLRGHYKTGEAIRKTIREDEAARTFRSANTQMRQRGWDVDLKLHREYDPGGSDVLAYARDIYGAVFSSVFAGRLRG